MKTPKHPISCALCGQTFNAHVTHSHLRARHGMTTAEYRALGHPLTSPSFYADRAARMSGASHPRWKGGRYLGKNGYIHLYREGRLLLEHRVVMERILGRKLLTSEHVHHRDGNRTNNAPENLELIPEREHAAMHLEEWWADGGTRRAQHPVPRVIKQCARCGKEILLRPAYIQKRLEQRGQKDFYCSKLCANRSHHTIS